MVAEQPGEIVGARMAQKKSVAVPILNQIPAMSSRVHHGQNGQRLNLVRPHVAVEKKLVVENVPGELLSTVWDRIITLKIAMSMSAQHGAHGLIIVYVHNLVALERKTDIELVYMLRVTISVQEITMKFPAVIRTTVHALENGAATQTVLKRAAVVNKVARVNANLAMHETVKVT